MKGNYPNGDPRDYFIDLEEEVVAVVEDKEDEDLNNLIDDELTATAAYWQESLEQDNLDIINGDPSECSTPDEAFHQWLSRLPDLPEIPPYVYNEEEEAELDAFIATFQQRSSSRDAEQRHAGYP